MADLAGIAIVGCGYWGINYVRVFSELPGARVVVVCDQRPERLQEVGRRFPAVALTTQLESALNEHGVDAVVVATSATTHYDITRRAIAAGKHVLVEKPLTTRSADAALLVEAAASRSVVLMVGHTFVYNAGIRKVKEYIQSGRDEVYYLYSSRTNLGPIRHDVNALWDLAPHDIAIFNFLLDSTPRWVSAVGAKVLRNCREDVGFISLGYQQGSQSDVVGHIHVSWADPHKARELVLVGSDRRIVFDDLNGVEQVRVFEKGVKATPDEPLTYGEYHLQIRDGDIVSPRLEVSEPMKNQCKHFLECVCSGAKPRSDGRDGEHVVRVLEAVDRSMGLKGAPVEVAKDASYDDWKQAV
ncbi:MAG TPA: Gfo/Idh/MocA family oxidoreductase [Vicinamibacterales bacterium]|jgi:predicted dehydrogenase